MPPEPQDWHKDKGNSTIDKFWHTLGKPINNFTAILTEYYFWKAIVS